MSSAEGEVRGVLRALTRKIGESREMLDAQNIGNALYGLQGMSSGEVNSIQFVELVKRLSYKNI
jgi:hypothetical protein